MSPSNSILSPQQYGHRTNHSTDLAIATYDNMTYSKGNNLTSTLFLDLSKVFDYVDDTTLLQKLFNHGVRGTPVNLLTIYLNNSVHCTKIVDIKSSFVNVTCGVL